MNYLKNKDEKEKKNLIDGILTKACVRGAQSRNSTQKLEVHQR
jgi:hypothetical protein